MSHISPGSKPACKFGLLLLILFLLGQPAPKAYAQDTVERKQQLEKLLQEVREEYGVPAMWAGWFGTEDGKLREDSYLASHGIRKFGQDQAVRDDDLVHLGSCTKAMTAVLTAQLITEGKLNWETTLGEVFADDPAVAESEGWSKVTISELLEHRSGAPANASWLLIEKQFPADVIAGRRAILHWLVNKKRPTKRSYLYSNVGYCMLGHVAEHIEGKPWEELIAERVFEPLGMESADTGPVMAKGNADALSQPWGHVSDGGANLLKQVGNLLGGESSSAPSWKPLRIDNAVPLGPAGRAHMSLKDWAKFVALFTNLEEADSRLGIESGIWKRLVEPKIADSNYAGGWILAERGWAGGQVLNHAGTNTTWFCIAWLAPKKDFFVLVACNAYSPQVSAACDKIAGPLVTSNSGVLTR